MKKYKCLVLMSGGLDSILAFKIMEENNVKAVPICFKSFFFNSEQAEETAKLLGVKLRIVDISKEHLKIVKNPKNGRGKGFNPCIDCHLLMIKTALKIMKKEKFDFIVTGEVLGQRPMSQNFSALQKIDKASGLLGLIVRPLSGKLLPVTIPEKKGMINKLYSISGRSRGEQIKLAKKFKIKKYPNPAGGCILTDIKYSMNLKKLLELKSNFSDNDTYLLKKGRIFWGKDVLIVVARNESECNDIIKLRKRNDVVLEPNNFSGPTVLVRRYKKSSREEMINLGIEYLLNYTKDRREDLIIKLLPFLKS
ncbi:MAG: tRNA 4-thiouridine(8) synthase ThiI [Candidatus Pacebacteria bacterium]|nr:tRNA 4-thiouridine(8) synthase ThiI [Candidatus Paceibacterota bacterium]